MQGEGAVVVAQRGRQASQRLDRSAFRVVVQVGSINRERVAVKIVEHLRPMPLKCLKVLKACGEVDLILGEHPILLASGLVRVSAIYVRASGPPWKEKETLGRRAETPD